MMAQWLVHKQKVGVIDGWSVQYLLDGGWKGKIENTCGKKSSCHNWELIGFSWGGGENPIL